jgi:mycothiol synthase
LMYLASSATQFPADEPRTPIEWRPSTDLTREELAQLVEATYEETLDCPALSDCRDVRDALVGYEKTGTSSVEHWRVARLGQNYIGCLLLADHPESDHLELVYVGLLRRYRGRHRSRWFVQTAQWMASQIGRSKLVLAVDSRNVPARKIYESEELWEWGRRRVLFRVVPLSRAETNRQERDG